MKSRKALSFAELLLAMTVVGIVASYTIPAFVIKLEDAQSKTSWRSNFSELTQVIARVRIDNGGTMIGANGSNVRTLRDKMLPYLSYAKSCGYNQVLGVCWHENGIIRNLKGEYPGNSEIEAGIVLSNGAMINLGSVSRSNCDYNWGSNQTIRFCNAMAIDLNGFKGPNVIGRDIFKFYILENRVFPYGGLGDQGENKPSCSCPDNGQFGAYCYPGAGCAAKYLMQQNI